MNDKEFPDNDDALLDLAWPEDPGPFAAPVESPFEPPHIDSAAEIPDERPNFDPYTGERIAYPQEETPVQEPPRFLHRVPELIELPQYNSVLDQSSVSQQDEPSFEIPAAQVVDNIPFEILASPLIRNVPFEFSAPPPVPVIETHHEPTPFDAPGEVPYEPPFVPVQYTPETSDETVRQSGLAWQAGIVFFGSVAFMMFLGWGADLLLGTSPWGLVGGIVLGSIIGFVQFFRISSQIFGKNKGESERKSFLSDD